MPDQFTPKLVSILREGYALPQFRSDAVAGLTVAVIALPLAMALAVASGASPDKGLILRLGQVPFLDASGALALEEFLEETGHEGIRVILCGARPDLRGLPGPTKLTFAPDYAAALELSHHV